MTVFRPPQHLAYCLIMCHLICHVIATVISLFLSDSVCVSFRLYYYFMHVCIIVLARRDYKTKFLRAIFVSRCVINMDQSINKSFTLSLSLSHSPPSLSPSPSYLAILSLPLSLSLMKADALYFRQKGVTPLQTTTNYLFSLSN